MRVITGIDEFRALLEEQRGRGASVGLVPTMGFLHDGHASLFRAAVDRCDVAVASIFVNPLQFGVNEDLDAYPRDLSGDLARAEESGIAAVFAPSVAEMYPGDPLTTVSVRGISEVMEGASRPTHFDGVATVVTKLFNIVGPCAAFFGEKDFQQIAVVRQLVADLNLAVEVVACPTVREPDGLARSSRNVNLTPEERAVAPLLFAALQRGAALVAGGETSVPAVETAMHAVLAGQSVGAVDYLCVVDSRSLQPTGVAGGGSRLFGAVRFSRARLIDNVGVQADAEGV